MVRSREGGRGQTFNIGSEDRSECAVHSGGHLGGVTSEVSERRNAIVSVNIILLREEWPSVDSESEREGHGSDAGIVTGNIRDLLR
jgi:hypothetical protein